MKSQVICLLISIFCGFSAKAGLASDVLNHHDLIPGFAAKGVVELYWSSPSKINHRLPAIVYIHGVQGEDRPGALNFVTGELLSSTAKLGMFAVGISMPGYGRSSGPADFCGRASQDALRTTLAWMRRQPDVDPNAIEVSGISCGATTAAMIADKEKLAGMVLVSGMYDFADMYAKWHTPQWSLEPSVLQYIENSVKADGGILTATQRRTSLPHADRFLMPILLVAGEKDKIVDFNQSQHLSNALKTSGHRVEMILDPNGEHMISYEDWRKHAVAFLTRIMKHP